VGRNKRRLGCWGPDDSLVKPVYCFMLEGILREHPCERKTFSTKLMRFALNDNRRERGSYYGT